jgi:hypothetical protein
VISAGIHMYGHNLQDAPHDIHSVTVVRSNSSVIFSECDGFVVGIEGVDLWRRHSVGASGAVDQPGRKR